MCGKKEQEMYEKWNRKRMTKKEQETYEKKEYDMYEEWNRKCM